MNGSCRLFLEYQRYILLTITLKITIYPLRTFQPPRLNTCECEHGSILRLYIFKGETADPTMFFSLYSTPLRLSGEKNSSESSYQKEFHSIILDEDALIFSIWIVFSKSNL